MYDIQLFMEDTWYYDGYGFPDYDLRDRHFPFF